MNFDGIPIEVWTAGTAGLLYGSAYAVVPMVMMEVFERVPMRARTRVRLGLCLLASNAASALPTTSPSRLRAKRRLRGRSSDSPVPQVLCSLYLPLEASSCNEFNAYSVGAPRLRSQPFLSQWEALQFFS